jgi:hypothetical protein
MAGGSGEGRRSLAFPIGVAIAIVAIVAGAVLLFSTRGSDEQAGPTPQERTEAEIRDTIEDARQAAAEEDAEAFCGYVSEGVTDTLRVNGDLRQDETCVDIVEANAASVAEVAAGELEIQEVAVTGRTARVTATLGGTGRKRFVRLGGTVVVGVTEEDGEWKLDELPEAG